MESCRTLQEYAYFVSRVRHHIGNLKDNNDKTGKYAAVSMAVNECIKQNVLADFLTKHKTEVVNMSIFEYDEEEAKEVFREDGRIEGRAEGLSEGFSKGQAQGMLDAKIADIIELLEDLGEIPQPLKDKICSQTDMDILKKWLKAAAKSSSITEFENLITQ